MKIERLFKRFIDDYKLPLQNIEDTEYIVYALSVINKYDEWWEFINRVKDKFGEDIEKYFNYYAEVKESFLNTVKNSSEFINFNQMDISIFKIDRPKNLLKSLYTKDNDNKYFLSIDLKKANFQALKYCKLFKGYDTWEDLIGKFTDFPELINSKYLRSVLFGQLNPSRHITVETYLVYNLIEPVKKFFPDSININLIILNSDELIFEVKDAKMCCEILSMLKYLEDHIKEKFDLDIKADVFQLKRHVLLFEDTKREIEFFEKWRFMSSDSTLRCIPATYYLIAYKLFYDKALNVYDYLIIHDGILATISEEAVLIN